MLGQQPPIVANRPNLPAAIASLASPSHIAGKVPRTKPIVDELGLGTPAPATVDSDEDDIKKGTAPSKMRTALAVSATVSGSIAPSRPAPAVSVKTSNVFPSASSTAKANFSAPGSESKDAFVNHNSKRARCNEEEAAHENKLKHFDDAIQRVVISTDDSWQVTYSGSDTLLPISVRFEGLEVWVFVYYYFCCCCCCCCYFCKCWFLGIILFAIQES